MPFPETKKIALVLTGAVSLGSFEAGVAYEIIRHIQHQEEPRLEIDVIVGTSAGALTGALVALALVFGLDPEILEKAWLSVRLEDLLKLNSHDRSLLSSSKVESLIAGFLRPPEQSLPIYNKEKEVNLAVVVTNLDGVKYEIHRANDDGFSISAIGYEDALQFKITPQFSEWDRLRIAVRASSAYPVAFEHTTIPRSHGEFKRTARYNFSGQPERDFHYSDGGIVNNQPLNKAIEIVNELPTDNSDGGERVFLVIDPTPPMAESLIGSNYGILDVVNKAVWTIPRNQTLYKDLLLLEKVNRRIRWKNSLVSALADAWNTDKLTPEKIQVINALSQEIAGFKGQTMLGIEPAKYLKYERERIKNAYKTEIQKAKDKDFFVKYCFLLEQVADLRNKQEISVEMIRPQDAQKELAGVILGNFGGFLNSEFMRHDFDVGRTYARRWLKKEMELTRLVHFREKKLSSKLQAGVFQRLFDNSIPIFIEDIAPKLFSGTGDSQKRKLGTFTIIRMVSTSLVKYLATKTILWTKEKVCRGLHLKA